MAPDAERTERSREIWEGVSGAWETYNDQIQELSGNATTWLLENLDTPPGATVLELAAGVGDLTIALAERVGEGGKVISSDFADGMVEALERRTADLENVEVQKIDAQDIGLPDDSVDAIAIRFGLMLMPDVAAVLDGCRRVLRAGGSLGAIVTGPPEANMWFTSLGMAATAEGVVPQMDPFEPGAMFSLSDQKVLETALGDAGFEEVRIEAVELRTRFASLDDFWDLQSNVSGPLAMALKGAPPEKLVAVKERLREIVAPFQEDDGSYRYSGEVNGVIAK